MTAFDVGIVGAGIHGASAAFHVAATGARAVIVERGTPASGPTGRSSAVCRAYYTNRFLATCARDSIAMFERFEELTGADPGHQRTGLLYLHQAADADAVRVSVAQLNELGIGTDLLEGEDLAAAAPGFELSDIAIGAYERHAGYVDPYAATDGLFRAAVRGGVEARLGRTVTGLDNDRSSATLTLDEGERLECGAILLATGPWTRLLALQVGVDLPLTVERHVVATFRWAGAEPAPAHGDLAGGYYFRPEGEELFLAGPLTPEPRVDPEDFDQEIRPDEVERLAASVIRRVPRLSVSQVHGGWASLYDVSPDWQPVIGEIAPHVFVDAGTSGHGFKLAPALGKHLAELTLGEETDPGLAAFDPFRFERGTLLRSGYGAARILG
ncbi:MAG: NAD(P)/FAD-dependent oxidoreductase [Actinomycetota bacterium]